jgi:acyl-CoA thioester hydrolase
LRFAQSGFVMAKFNFDYRVSYADCTVGNHVYYARYLDVLEKARGEFFRKLGTTFVQWQEQNAIFPVIEVRLRYKAPARYDEVLNCEVWISRAEGARLNFAYRIAKPDQIVILEGETFHVCTGLDEKPKRLPEALIDLLAPFHATENASDNPKPA